MADDEDRDPLLVRPYLQDGRTADGDPGNGAEQTWPATDEAATADQATADQATADRATADRATADRPTADRPTADRATDDATAVIALPSDPLRPRHARPGRRRVLVLAAIVIAVLLGAGVAGFAALRNDVAPVGTALPDDPLPAVTGPQPATSAPVTPSPTVAPTSRRNAAAATTRPSSAAATTPSVMPSTLTRVSPSATAGSPAPTSTGDRNAAQPAGEAVAPAPPQARTGTIRGQNGLCLDLNGGVPVDDNHVQVFDCNTSGAQVWTLETDGTLRVVGKCALVVGDGTVHIVGCDGRSTAQWRASGQLLINASNNGCLTDPSGGARSGTGVTVIPCSGSAQQRWSLP